MTPSLAAGCRCCWGWGCCSHHYRPHLHQDRGPPTTTTAAATTMTTMRGTATSSSCRLLPWRPPTPPRWPPAPAAVAALATARWRRRRGASGAFGAAAAAVAVAGAAAPAPDVGASIGPWACVWMCWSVGVWCIGVWLGLAEAWDGVWRRGGLRPTLHSTSTHPPPSDRGECVDSPIKMSNASRPPVPPAARVHSWVGCLWVAGVGWV